jgi:hypothetical protein
MIIIFWEMIIIIVTAVETSNLTQYLSLSSENGAMEMELASEILALTPK